MTGSGKTFTLQGGIGKNAGMIPRTIEYIFKNKPKNHQIFISFLEIYNEKVFDLLSKTPTRDLQIREDGSNNVFIQGLTESPIKAPFEFTLLYENGLKKRTTAFTDLNHSSSRSHAVIIIKVYFLIIK